jgi:RNA polymerase sigma-70 factor (ECF subfamily)
MSERQTAVASESPTRSDEDLLARSAAGDADAFTQLYRRRQGCLYRFALQMSGRPAAAEEVTQDVFMLLIREPGQYDSSRGTLAAFLYGVARNFMLRHLERERRHVSISDEKTAQFAVSSDLAGDLDRTQQVDQLRQAILALPARYREIVVLCDLHELSYNDAAQVTGCAVGTVRSRLHRARVLLAGKLRTTSDSDGRRCFA